MIKIPISIFCHEVIDSHFGQIWPEAKNVAFSGDLGHLKQFFINFGSFKVLILEVKVEGHKGNGMRLDLLKPNLSKIFLSRAKHQASSIKCEV